MTLRGFLIFFFIILALFFGTYFFFSGDTESDSFNAPKESPILKQVSILGKLTCLPHRDNTGPQTEECAIGVEGEDGLFYGLLGLNQTDLIAGTLSTDSFVNISGIMDSTSVTAPALWNKYDVSGTIIISDIEDVSSATAEPDKPGEGALSSYPDLSLDPIPAVIFTPKMILEHRSALNGRTIPLRGVVTSNLLGDDACPPDAGACAKPRIFIGESLDEDRDKSYDIMVLLSEGDITDYSIGSLVTVTGTVFGSSESVYLLKTY
ncbi:MAG: hypothetical protein COU07_04190 [Candidatus Harrisonbacteria bacterium CG10_big_fil_rev_8_21_14_0_10_40_38]|uniref:Uncharacterized protein n=1 Tax=Candidatus Harrisonbacteria bacterium CG10_big_fil_rev_8_21_14_0_10_40_38 TaxID=1974583 RepID=A0A2H0UR34_9BACT|nr:MAG: hypothetical protein COU07_04190 [Candidatus Harrisonbacteria bacterium CG10_big_fil_rev_8_21_14_0_10_40_38]